MARSQIGMARTVATARFLVRDFVKCLSFNGVANVVTMGNAASLQLTTGSQSVWIKTTTPGSGTRVIFEKENAYGMFLSSNVFKVFDWTVGFRGSGGTLNDGNWHHLVFTFQDGVASGSKIYTDSVLQSTFTYNIQNQTNGLSVAKQTGGDTQAYQGLIDDPAICNVVLTQSQINDIYFSNIFPTTGLVSRWKFDEGSGTSATDSAGTNTGTITGATYSSNVFIVPRTTAGIRTAV